MSRPLTQSPMRKTWETPLSTAVTSAPASASNRAASGPRAAGSAGAGRDPTVTRKNWYAASVRIHVVSTNGKVSAGTVQVVKTLPIASVTTVVTAAPTTSRIQVDGRLPRNVGSATPVSSGLNPYIPWRSVVPSTARRYAAPVPTTSPTSAPTPTAGSPDANAPHSTAARISAPVTGLFWNMT